ncbi:hypothetical protein BJY04DRAFT_224301 [Aspergillus karnatakaensis]|uniref:uncharacterized protein n=1 Tax=Aspergillus karnatakaensis TaxID=1810916 RepID=UPI003CCD7F3D
MALNLRSRVNRFPDPNAPRVLTIHLPHIEGDSLAKYVSIVATTESIPSFITTRERNGEPIGIISCSLKDVDFGDMTPIVDGDQSWYFIQLTAKWSLARSMTGTIELSIKITFGDRVVGWKKITLTVAAKLR